MTTAERQVVVPAPGATPRPETRGRPRTRLAPAHRDGLALVLSSGLTSAVGLLYWVIAARLFPPAVLGVNQVALNTMMLLGSVAHLNMTYALLRFVPVAGLASRRLVALGYLAAIVFAALVGGVFALGSEIWAPELAEGLGYGRLVVFFLVATPVWSLFVIQDFVLTAVKKATAVPAENAVFSVLKIALLVVAYLGAVDGGIAISWVVATAVIVLGINAWLLFRVLPAHGRANVASATPITLGGFTRFIRADYAGAVLWQCALFGLPLLVLARLGAESAAVYSIVWTISQALYTVSSGMGQSMVAHSASDLAGLEKARRAMVRRAMMLVAPVAVVVSVGAPLWLSVFGEHYAANGAVALILASLSAIPNVITASTVNAARVRQRMSVLFGVPGTLALMVIVGSWVLMPHLGITGVGLSWLVAQTLMAIGILIATAPWLPPLLSTRIDAMRSAALVRRVRPLANEHNASSPEEWGLGDLIAGKSDSIVIDFKNLSGGTGALLKAADSVAGRSQLLRQTEVLDRLHAETRLGGWRALVPTIERAGYVGGSYCIVESRLPGERGVGAPPAHLDPGDRRRRPAHPLDPRADGRGRGGPAQGAPPGRAGAGRPARRARPRRGGGHRLGARRLHARQRAHRPGRAGHRRGRLVPGRRAGHAADGRQRLPPGVHVHGHQRGGARRHRAEPAHRHPPRRPPALRPHPADAGQRRARQPRGDGPGLADARGAQHREVAAVRRQPALGAPQPGHRGAGSAGAAGAPGPPRAAPPAGAAAVRPPDERPRVTLTGT